MLAHSLIVLTGLGLAAQDTTALTYTPDDFAAVNPASAYDMVSQVPGFRIQDGEDRRGFAGASGNVLIDGVRPNSKTEALEDLLKRIPAKQVLRIEARRDSDAGAGGLGQSLLVNVVRVPLSVSGVWSTGAEIANTGQPAPNGYAALSGRFRRTDYSFGLSTYSLRRNLPGARETRDSSGTLTGRTEDSSPRAYVQYAANGELGHDLWGGKIRANASTSHSKYQDASLARHSHPSGGLTAIETNPYGETFDRREAGLNFERGLSGGDLKLAGLSMRRRFNSDIVSTSSGPDGTLWARYRQSLRRDAAEDIVRLSYSRPWNAKHRFDGGVEMARNSLDARAVVSLDLGAGPFPLHIPNANIRIGEQRAEAYVSDTWTPLPAWSVETRLAWETSRLTFTGDTQSVVDLSYLKPSLQVSRTLGRHQLRFKLARDVGQLDFNDFTSAAAFADNRINGGNPDLRPQATWRGEVAIDGRFGASTTLNLRIFHDAIEDANDLVPITRDGITYDAPGNIGDAEVTGAQLVTHLPLAPVVPGGRLDIDVLMQDSSVRDPSNGEDRPLSKLPRSKVTAAFRQDIPKSRYAWGVSYTAVAATRRYYVNEIDIQRESPSLDAFIERRIGSSAKLAITARSLMDNEQTRRRLFYASPRPAPLQREEARTSRPGSWLYVTLSGWF